MISHLRQIVCGHWVSAMCGVLTGIAGATICIIGFVNFAPFANEASSAWSAVDLLPLDQRKPESFYQPRVDDLLGRLRLNGRCDGSVWQSLREATDAWLLADPVGCLNHLIKNGGTGLIDDALLSDALQRATGGNFAVALTRADEIADGRVRNRWIKRAFLNEAKDDPESAFIALRSVPRQLTGELSWLLIREWTAKDGQKAFQTFFESRDPLSLFVMASWAAQDPDGAYAFVSNSLVSARLQNGVTLTPAAARICVMNSIAHQYPDKAIELAKAIPDDPARSNVIRNAIQRIAETDPQRALQVVDGLSGDLLRLRMREEIARAAVAKDSTLAEQIRQTLPGERARSNVATAGVWSGGYENCAAAAKKAVAIADPFARSDAMHSAAGVWLQKKPLEAIQFTVEAAQAGNALWLRVLADAMLDNAERAPMQPVLPPASVQKISDESRAQLRAEIAKRPPSPARDQFLQSLK